MNRTISTILVAVGLTNLYPVIGVLSADSLSNLYGVIVLDNDLLILMRHRAMLFGILGVFIITSVFRPHLQVPAIIAGLVSMISFVGLVLEAGEFGKPIENVLIADIIGSLALIVVIFLKWKSSHASKCEKI